MGRGGHSVYSSSSRGLLEADYMIFSSVRRRGDILLPSLVTSPGPTAALSPGMPGSTVLPRPGPPLAGSAQYFRTRPDSPGDSPVPGSA